MHKSISSSRSSRQRLPTPNFPHSDSSPVFNNQPKKEIRPKNMISCKGIKKDKQGHKQEIGTGYIIYEELYENLEIQFGDDILFRYTLFFEFENVNYNFTFVDKEHEFIKNPNKKTSINWNIDKMILNCPDECKTLKIELDG